MGIIAAIVFGKLPGYQRTDPNRLPATERDGIAEVTDGTH